MDPGTRSGPAASVGVSCTGLTACTALEVVLVYAGIIAYIWRWGYTHPRYWIALWGVILASHFLHHDTPRTLGLSLSGMRANAELILPIALAFCLPLLAVAVYRHALTLVPLNRHAAASFLGYGSWCVFQQYLTQSYFHNRLMEVVHSRRLRSFLVGIMFGSAHLPNPILTIATTVAGTLFAEVFARHRNIWPLGLAQVVGGFLLAAISPASIMHNMRVGPGYFFYGIR